MASFPRKRESSLCLSFEYLFRLRRDTSFASPKEVSKKRRPYGVGPGAYAPRLPCDARDLRRLRNSPVLRRAQTVLADYPSDRCASRRPQRGRSTAKHWFAVALADAGAPCVHAESPAAGIQRVSPLGAPRSAGSRGVFREDCLSRERSEDGEFRRSRVRRSRFQAHRAWMRPGSVTQVRPRPA